MIDIDGLEGIKFTGTELRIMELLGDGKPHFIVDILEELFDPYTTRKNLSNFISSIRGKIQPMGFGVLVCFERRKMQYRLVKLLGDIIP